MGHHNNYTNYSKPQVMSEPTPDAENTLAPTLESVEPEETIDTIAVEAAQLAVDAEEEVAPPPEPLDGVVTAAKLNVRKLPSPNAEVLAVINQNSKVQIDTEASTVDWYKVYTAAGVEGYCMKKFITVK